MVGHLYPACCTGISSAHARTLSHNPPLTLSLARSRTHAPPSLAHSTPLSTDHSLLHWHLVDYQSFPFASAAAPALVHGAYSPGQTYSPAELKEMVAYAKDRAVRVMVEVDTPGHSGSWGVGYPGVVTDCPDVPLDLGLIFGHLSSFRPRFPCHVAPFYSSGPHLNTCRMLIAACDPMAQ